MSVYSRQVWKENGGWSFSPEDGLNFITEYWEEVTVTEPYWKPLQDLYS